VKTQTAIKLKQSAKKLKQFTTKHLPDILFNSPDIIWAKEDNSLMVGELRVYKNKHGTYSVNLAGGKVCNFYKQKHAVCYASYYQLCNLNRCSNIAILDSKLENYTQDVEYYKQQLTLHYKNNNKDKFLLYYARYSQALPIKKQTEQECKKSIFLAKYN